MTDVNNYRANMISNAVSIVLQFVLYGKLTSRSPVDEYQFDYKARHSTGLCTSILKRTVN